MGRGTYCTPKTMNSRNLSAFVGPVYINLYSEYELPCSNDFTDENTEY